MSLRNGLRRALDGQRHRVRFAGRLSLLALFVAVALILSTVDLGDSAQARAFEGGFFTALIPWAVVIFVGAEGVWWLRREARRARRRHEDRRR